MRGFRKFLEGSNCDYAFFFFFFFFWGGGGGLFRGVRIEIKL